MRRRCAWAGDDPEMVEYHDMEWGVPLHDDQRLFEFLVLEGAQAGLSWSTILHKRAGYRRAFEGFDPERVARFGEGRVERLLSDPGIVRNRLKVKAAVTNAKVFLKVQAEFGSFDRYLWSFVDGNPVRNDWSGDGPTARGAAAAKRMSADMRRRGFKFVGPTICYALMQAVGMVNDHEPGCYRYSEIG